METVTCQRDKCNRKLGEQSQVFGESPVLEMIICVKKVRFLLKVFYRWPGEAEAEETEAPLLEAEDVGGCGDAQRFGQA